MATTTHIYYQKPEALVVALARTGDRIAFEELVRRRQSWIRNLMRRCCGNATLADDLAQQVFLQAWIKISYLKNPNRFGAWLKRLAINIWLQHARKNDVMELADGDGAVEIEPAPNASPGLSMDLDRALLTLSSPARLCLILSYYEGMTHPEIASHTDIPLGTVKSHIKRGTEHLQQQLADYVEQPPKEDNDDRR